VTISVYAVYRNKRYWCCGPFEVQWGCISHTLGVFWRRPWRCLVLLRVPKRRAVNGDAS
jgi:hypothetical protein